MGVDVTRALSLFRSSYAAEELSIRQIEELLIAKPQSWQSQFASVLGKPFLVCGENCLQTLGVGDIAVERQLSVIFDASLGIGVAIELFSEAVDGFGDVS